MRSRGSTYRFHGTVVAGLAVTLLGLTVIAPPVFAAERKFLVSLADTGKKELAPCNEDQDCRNLGGQFVCRGGFSVPGEPYGGRCVFLCNTTADCIQFDPQSVCGIIPDGFAELNGVCRSPQPNPELIRREYFDNNPSNTTTSFAEYFREISYGDITVTGEVTDWVLVPWRLGVLTGVPNDPRDIFPDLPGDQNDGDGFILPVETNGPGVFGEPFDNRFRMLDRNIGKPQDDYIFRGGLQRTTTGVSVFTPGERFQDLNGNDVWDGIDERRNSMDFATRLPDGTLLYTNTDGHGDLLGPWVDLNENGVGDNQDDCIYIPDADNDGNPDCCPKGVSPMAENGIIEISCRGLVGTPVNLISQVCPPTTWEGPDGTITDCNGNLVDDAIDIFFGNSDDVIPGTADGETCADGPGDGIPDECQARVGSSPCVLTDPDPCITQDPPPACCACTPPDGGARIVRPRCEFHDINENGVLDDPEPFENFFPGRPTPAYIRNNFPGTNPDAVIARGATRRLSGAHDPFRKLSLTADKRCSDGSAYTDATGANCEAGIHAEYDSPDLWDDAGTAKVDVLFPNGLITPKPDWYEQAWRDRYGANAVPPPWNDFVFEVRNRSDRATNDEDPPLIPFDADRGGIDGRGLPPTDADVETARILPDQLLGLNARIIYYDGPVEFDDVPSSKYHRGGDRGLGEATSPFASTVYGEDRGRNIPDVITSPDGFIPAAGPYATRVHGQRGRDGGNVLQFEMLTRRNEPPFNNSDAWERINGFSHPFAGALGGNLGFRDYNLDGAFDVGSAKPVGSDTYAFGFYPWSKERFVEDVVEALDEGLDFDDYADPVANEQLICVATNPPETNPRPSGPAVQPLPPPYDTDGTVNVFGAASGIVLLPIQAPVDRIRGFTRTGFRPVSPIFRPIHNEDGLGDVAYVTSVFPKQSVTPQIAWNIRFPDLVLRLDESGEYAVSRADFQTAIAAHEYLHAWEAFPDLYDLDGVDRSGVENCPMGEWDIMSKGGLVHPIPALKESPCTDWVEPVDLTTVLTPGVTASVTLPPSELVRDNAYFFLENEDRPGRFDPLGNYIPGERYYIWSAGSGFNSRTPGPGMMLLHADANSSNPDAVASQQRNGARPAYTIVQADGLDELRACAGATAPFTFPVSDAGDPFPSSTNQTAFDCETNPASEWYTDSSCSGLDIESVSLDGTGSVLVTMNWTPTSIPSLRFIDPPGGVSVGNPPNALYNVRAEANDVFGGTRIRFFYTTSEAGTPDPVAATSHPITLLRKTTPGFVDISTNWNVSSLTDGRYYLFADLIPAAGADGTERKFTEPRAGRNNQGTATLQVLPADVLTSTLNASGQVAVQGKARSETWTMRCINATTGEWVVNSSLTLPVPKPDAANQDPYPHALTGTKYDSAAGGVSFTIQPGPAGNANRLGVVGDTFTFTTTGITARSEGVTVRNGRISEDPVAVIDATPLSGLPPLLVSFDARRSTEPNGAPLTYRWTFGDGSAPVPGSQPQHEYRDAGTFTVTLRATNTTNGRFGEASVDIRVINNSPSAEIRATPASGIAPLVVNFNASQSSDAETPPDQLIYQWEFGDGTSANDARVPGLSFREVSHTYSRKADGTQCTVAAPCSFTATLTVTDDGGVTDTDSTIIRIGNTNPVANVTFSPLVGPSPLTVTFNAKNSTDAESDPIEVEWIWGDGTANEIYGARVGKPPATDGSVPHTFTLPAGQVTKSFTVRAILRDITAVGTRKGGETSWPGVTVTVTTLVPDANHPPTARFSVTPLEGIVGEPLSFDAAASTDADGDDLRFQWDFGDGNSTQLGSTPTATHAYDQAGTFTVRLTVYDEDDATATTTQVIRILAEGANRNPTAIVATGPRTGPAPLNQTFDGRLSFDPDLESLSYTWRIHSGELLIDTLTGAVATRIFENEGTFTVTLTVQDVRGGSDTADAVTIVVAGELEPPDDGGEPPRPGPTDPPDSANQRPTPFVCGLGMLGALFATWAGLGLTALLRRRGIR